jgi:uncharacterized protein with PIN domain
MNVHDQFAEKLRLKERAEEDVFFARRDRELLRHLREGSEEEQRRRVRELSHMRCPECGARLVQIGHHGVTVEECPVRHGMWMTDAQMRTLARRESNSWIGRYFYRPKPVV